MNELVQPLDRKESRTRLEPVAEKLVQLVLDGDIQTAKDIGKHLDGRPMQPAQVQADWKNMVRFVE